MLKLDKQARERVWQKIEYFCFNKNGLGWFAVIGFLAPPFAMLYAEREQIVWGRVAISMVYFGIGVLLTRLAIPPLKQGLRPLEYLLGAVGWPLVVFCLILVVAIECYSEIVKANEELKGVSLFVAMFLIQLFGNCESIQDKIIDHWDLEDAIDDVVE